MRLGPSGRRFDPCHSDQNLTESRVYSPLSVIFYAYLGISPPLLKNAFLRPHHQMWAENSFIFVYSGSIFESQTSNRHRFSCGGCLNNYLTVRPDLSRSFSAAISAFFCLIISSSFSSHSSLVSV